MMKSINKVFAAVGLTALAGIGIYKVGTEATSGQLENDVKPASHAIQYEPVFKK